MGATCKTVITMAGSVCGHMSMYLEEATLCGISSARFGLEGSMIFSIDLLLIQIYSLFSLFDSSRTVNTLLVYESLSNVNIYGKEFPISLAVR